MLKLVYLPDYHFNKLTGKSISTFEYKWHHNRPFDSSFYDDINCLKEDAYIEEEEVHFPTCCDCVFHDTSHYMTYDELSTMLEYVIKTYGKVNLQTILYEILYETEPMKELTGGNAFGEKIPMSIVYNKDKEELYEGLAPEDIIEGEKAIKEGKARSLKRFLVPYKVDIANTEPNNNFLANHPKEFIPELTKHLTNPSDHPYLDRSVEAPIPAYI